VLLNGQVTISFRAVTGRNKFHCCQHANTRSLLLLRSSRALALARYSVGPLAVCFAIGPIGREIGEHMGNEK
jgi:hypothetical protein